MSASRRVVGGIISLVTLALLLGGVPLALVGVGGNPFPGDVPSPHEIGRALVVTDTGSRLLIRTVLVVAWLGWVAFALSVLVELPARLRGRRAMRLPGLRWAQRWAAGLLAGVTLLFSSPAMAATSSPVASPPAAIAATPAPHAPYTVVAAAPSDRLVYEVKRGDYLGFIALRFLGDFNRYPEIAALNRNHIPDRSGPHGPSHIEATWQLRLPNDAFDRGPIRHATGMVVPSTHTGKAGGNGGAGSDDGAGTDKPSPPPIQTTDAPPATPTAANPSLGAQTPTGPTATGPGAGVPTVPGSGHGSTDSGGETHAAQVDAAAGRALLAAIAGASAAGVVAAQILLWRRRRSAADAHGNPADEAESLDVPIGRLARDLGRLDLALRDLGGGLADRPPPDMPDIIGAWLSAGAVHLMLTGPCPPPPEPWIDSGNKWTLPAHASTYTYFAAPQPPLPALVTIGAQDDAAVLMDLERLGLVTISGEPRAAHALLRHMVVELCHSAWGEDLTVTIAGFDDADVEQLVAVGGGRVRPMHNASAAIDEAAAWARDSHDHLRALRLADTFSGRLARGDEPRNLMPHMLFLAEPSPADLSRLAVLDEDLSRLRRGPLAIAVTTSVPLGRWPLVVDADRRMTVDFLDTRIRAVGLTRDDLSHLAEIQENARRQPVAPDDEVPVGRHRLRAKQHA